MINESQAVNALDALAQETRLQVVRVLVHAGNEGMAAGEIGKLLEVAPSRLSFHLATLEKGELVAKTRVSRQIIYKANFERIGALLGYLVDDCCGGDSTILQAGALQKCC